MRRSIRRGAFVVAVVAAVPHAASAHHVPGHGASESVRNINSLGARGGRSQSRLLVLSEFSTITTGLNPGQTYNFSLLGEYAPIPSFSFGVQLPFDVAVQAKGPTVYGYGNTRAFVHYTPHAAKLVHRVLTFGLGASFPTRTYELSPDPGKRWSVTPWVLFSRTYASLFYQVNGLATVETRPAGQAIDLSAAGQLGVRSKKRKVAFGSGMLVDVRVANFCAEVDGGSNYCAKSRASEVDREPGATRVMVLSTFNWTFASWGALNASLQTPVSRRRDFDVAGSLGFQAMF